MPLSGAWLQAKKAPDPMQALRHLADPNHFDIGASGVEQGPETWAAPPYQAAPAMPWVGMEWVTRDPGISDPPGPTHADAVGHENPDGGSLVQKETAVEWQHSDEKYYTMEFRANPGDVSDAPPDALIRGKNANAINNPPDESYGGEGFRRGLYRWTNLDRYFSPPLRVHDQRMVGPNTATLIGDAPPPSDPNTFNSPYSSLAVNRRNKFAIPFMRRIPPSFDQAVITDGSELAAAPPQHLIGGSWVAG